MRLVNVISTREREQPLTITYLSGAVRPEALARRMDFGVLLTPDMGNRPAKLGMHAHDNGCYAEFISGGAKPFSEDRFWRHLDKFREHRTSCLFATAPDVVGDWEGTLERSAPFLPEIRARGYRAALVAQDGLEDHMDRIPWDDFDVLFLGGGQDEKYLSKVNRVRTKDGRWVGEWKLSSGAARLTREARRHGKDVHMGRVNSLKRLLLAQEMGCTSADGTICKYPSRTAEARGWVVAANEGAQHVKSCCFICRWKIERLPAVVYGHMTIQAAIAKYGCDHRAVSPSVERRLRIERLSQRYEPELLRGQLAMAV